jgi:hypothetical protein
LIIAGDFNARLHARLDTEANIIGPQTFGKGTQYLEEAHPQQLDNRDRFLSFLTINSLVAISIWGPPCLNKIVTYQEPGTQGPDGIFAPEQFAQLDFIIVQQRWKT